ncbi:MAG: hypothetical protein AAGM04_06475, partial [Pseudomonadota bacterium]
NDSNRIDTNGSEAMASGTPSGAQTSTALATNENTTPTRATELSFAPLKGTIPTAQSDGIDLMTTASVNRQPEPVNRTVRSDTPTSADFTPNNTTFASSTAAKTQTLSMTISSARSQDIVRHQLAALKAREPELFAELSPRIVPTVKNGITGYNLLAEPFASKEHAAHFCRAIRLRLTLNCESPTQ